MLKRNTFFAAILSLLGAGNVIADTWTEREALSQLQSELSAIQSLIEHARVASDDAARMQFDYVQLSLDLETIQKGINQFLTHPIDPVMSSVDIELEGAYTNLYRDLPTVGDVRVRTELADTSSSHCTAQGGCQ